MRSSVATNPNAAQQAAWDGQEGAYWAEHADRYDRAVAGHHTALMTSAAIEPADRVLDIGCGTGQTTREAASAAPSGRALGLDLSSEMLIVARHRADAAGVTNVDFEHADAQLRVFEVASFDVAISRMGTMFFADREAAHRNIARALRPGGRLASIVWQPADRNEWFGEIAGALSAGRGTPVPPAGAPGPFAMADQDSVGEMLRRAGFVDITIDPVLEPMWFGTDATDAERFILGQMAWMLDGLDEAHRADALAALRVSLRAHEGATGVTFGSAVWLVCGAAT